MKYYYATDSCSEIAHRVALPLYRHAFLDLRLFNSLNLWCLGLCYCCQARTLETHLGEITALTRWWTARSINAETLEWLAGSFCPAYRTYEIATRFWEVVICPIYMCLTVYEFSFILFDLCLFITIFNFILNYVLIVTFWIFTYYKIWIILIIYCFIWNYLIFYFVTCLGVLWSVMS